MPGRRHGISRTYGVLVARRPLGGFGGFRRFGSWAGAQALSPARTTRARHPGARPSPRAGRSVSPGDNQVVDPGLRQSERAQELFTVGVGELEERFAHSGATRPAGAWSLGKAPGRRSLVAGNAYAWDCRPDRVGTNAKASRRRLPQLW